MGNTKIFLFLSQPLQAPFFSSLGFITPLYSILSLWCVYYMTKMYLCTKPNYSMGMVHCLVISQCMKSKITYVQASIKVSLEIYIVIQGENYSITQFVWIFLAMEPLANNFINFMIISITFILMQVSFFFFNMLIILKGN